MRKFLAVFMSLFILLSAIVPVSAATETRSNDIVILYTNDIHTYIDGPLSYDVIAALKKVLQKQYKYVFLADAGDHIQGTAYGSMDKGESIIKMMNAAEYDIATLGNHEFDYGMNGCLYAIELAEFPYVSANFHHEENGICGENVLDSFVMFDCGEEKLAFVGITTPETFSKSTPAYFKDENGNFIYGISAGEDGADLQQEVQKAIDEAKEAGATQVVALGHLGIDSASQPWTSIETIAGVCGLNAFIDGHSHSIVEGEVLKDKDGHDVLLTQTGEYFNRIGMMVIDSETDQITTDFIECEEILAPDGETVEGYQLDSELYNDTELISDAAVKELKDAWLKQIDDKLGQKIGSTELTFDNYDAEGNRLVRSQETNSGDFAADALYYLFDNMGLDVDVAIMNSGGIRNKAITGDISYKTCKDMHTFGNVACLQTVTGQQILDALEWGARKLGVGENGGFLQVSGLTYKIDPTVANTTKEDELEAWLAGSSGGYRVYDVNVYNKETNAWEALDITAEYNLAGYNYTLRDLGDGFHMFDGAVNVLDYVMEDYMVLANYVQGFDEGVVEASNSPLGAKYPGFLVDYSTLSGSGRIGIAENSSAAIFDDEVWVGGVQITAANKDDVLGDGGSVKYDPTTDTLTLTDATITNESGHGIYSHGINLTVNGIDTDAKGSNSISSAHILEDGIDEEGNPYTFSTPGHGIFSEGNGNTENGGLVLTGTLGDITAEGGNGVNAYEDIVIQGTVGTISCSGGIASGISSDFGSVIVEKTGKIESISSQEYDGISTFKSVILKGKAGNINGGGYAGIHVLGGDVTISGNVETITGLEVGIESYYAMEWNEDGNEGYSGGNVTINGAIGKISGGSIGIYTDADLNISGSAVVTATNAERDDKCALSIGGDLVLPDGKDIITEPAEYQINAVLAEIYEDETGLVELWHNTLCTSDGTPAQTVKFEGFVNPFEDVNTSDWYYGDVEYAVENGLFNGTTETTFAPNDHLTRGMLVTVLYRAEGEPEIASLVQREGDCASSGGIVKATFTDVDENAYYANAVSWAKQNGIVNGETENEFAPDANITREQIAAILYRYAQYKGYDISVGESTNLLSYDDFNQISEYAISAIEYAVANSLLQGKSETTLNPLDNATRAETAALLHRFLVANK